MSNPSTRYAIVDNSYGFENDEVFTKAELETLIRETYHIDLELYVDGKWLCEHATDHVVAVAEDEGSEGSDGG